MDDEKKRESIRGELGSPLNTKAEKYTPEPKLKYINAIFGGIAGILIILMLFEIWVMFEPYLHVWLKTFIASYKLS